MFQVPDFHRVFVAHEVELVCHVVVPYWVYVGFALRVSGSESEWCLAAGQKRVNLRLVHSRSIRHRCVDPDGCQDAREQLWFVLVTLPIFLSTVVLGSGPTLGEIDIFITGLGRSRKSRVAFSIPL